MGRFIFLCFYGHVGHVCWFGWEKERKAAKVANGLWNNEDNEDWEIGKDAPTVECDSSLFF